MTTNIVIECKDQVLTLIKSPVIASGGVNEDTVEFVFSEEWENFEKTATFYRSTDEIYSVILDENNKCMIPSAVLKDPGTLYIGLYGKSGDVTRTTGVLVYYIVQGVNTDAPVPEGWEKFKKDVIDAINYRFGTEISHDIDNLELINTIFTLDMSVDFRLWITNVINDKFGTELPSDASAEDIVYALLDVETGISVRMEVVDALNAKFDTGLAPDADIDTILDAISVLRTVEDGRHEVIEDINIATMAGLDWNATDEEIKAELSTLATPANLWKTMQYKLEHTTDPFALPFITSSDGRENKGNVPVPIDFGRIDTSRVIFNLYVRGGAMDKYTEYGSLCNLMNGTVEKVDIDFSSSTGQLGNNFANNNGNFTNFFTLASNSLKKLTLRGLANITLHGVASLYALEEINLVDEPNIESEYCYSGFLSQCPNLVSVGGVEIDLSNANGDIFNGVPNYPRAARSFAYSPNLENIHFKKDSIKFRFYMDDSKALSQDSTLSLINALDTEMPNTISLHADVKIKCDTWRGKLVNGLWIITDEPIDDVNVFSFTTIIAKKNWAIG